MLNKSTQNGKPYCKFVNFQAAIMDRAPCEDGFYWDGADRAWRALVLLLLVAALTSPAFIFVTTTTNVRNFAEPNNPNKKKRNQNFLNKIIKYA